MVSEYVLSAGERLKKSDDELIKALFTSSAVGMIIGRNATLSGAEGGCQAECGSASAMAADTLVGGIRTNIQCLKEKRGEK